ncbi:MAG: ABC transporter substrate-binding protein [Gammaproteobacteria bacterium]|nr:ABC transporter substrate-binding protein [Gammaproteobacteria bacterium]
MLLVAAFASARAQAAVEPQDFVRETSEQVFQALDREGDALAQNPRRLYQMVDTLLLQHMDFARMSRWVLGKHWKTATPEQQARFMVEFRGLLVRTYATALAGYRGRQVRILPQREAGDSDEMIAREVVVRTEVNQPNGPAIPVNYSLYLRDGQWKAFDVQIDGISLIANYRATFGAEVRAAGGLEALIQALAARNRQALNTQ